jgi:acetylornithine deacetylase/succinyl-diaminopimelate desuccinylase-like protein
LEAIQSQYRHQRQNQSPLPRGFHYTSSAGLKGEALRPLLRLRTACLGGGSDGNFTAAVGIPTLDGLGVTGHGAHAADEHIVLEQLPVRAALLAHLLVSF